MTVTKRKSPVKGAMDVLFVTDLPGFADRCGTVDERWKAYNEVGSHWAGSKSWDLSVSQVRNGDMSGVAASDEIMSKIEVDNLVTQTWQETLDVIGGVPNVPAFLAGHPLTMRRLERVADERGPLTVFAAMEISSDISIETIRKRGAAVLALIRALSAIRPVELYAVCSGGGAGYGSYVVIRIDTAPLDIARAAHVLTCPSVTRGLGYSMHADQSFKELSQSWRGHWAYGNVSDHRKHMRDVLVSAVAPGSEALLLPGAHSHDPCVQEPVTWLKDMIRQYGGFTED